MTVMTNSRITFHLQAMFGVSVKIERVFTEISGVILYEMWARRVPYYEVSDAVEVAQCIAYKGLRLEIPESMPPVVKQLMGDCHQTEPGTFSSQFM